MAQFPVDAGKQGDDELQKGELELYHLSIWGGSKGPLPGMTIGGNH